MKIYAVENVTWDGIAYQRLFQTEASAKVHARKKNREIGIKGYYTVTEKQVAE